MKKILCVLLVAVLAISLCGCDLSFITDILNKVSKAPTQQELWDQLDGIWAAYADDMLYFVCFTEEGDVQIFSTGTLFSSDIMGGTVSGYEKDEDNSVYMEVFCPAVNTEETQREGITLAVTVNYEKAEEDTISVSVWVKGSAAPTPKTYVYVATGFDTLRDYEDVIAKVQEKA